MGFLAMLLVAGCSSDNPSNSTELAEKTNDLYNSLAEIQLQLSGQVATIDYNAQTLTLNGVAETIIADDECYIFTMIEGVETPLVFDDIVIGDSVQVCGNYPDESTFLANRIRVYGENECPDYDVAFRDTIVTIDYSSGTFTVANRDEIIKVDENTLIWGRIGSGNAMGETGDYTPSDGGTVEDIKDRTYVDTTYVFTDLEPGDIVEVRAFIVDDNTLLAAVIKVANTQDLKSTTFTAALETIDCDTRAVTFEGEDWVGTVCPDAILLDADGGVLTLCEFQAGDLVAVKGFPMDDGTLKIYEMILQ